MSRIKTQPDFRDMPFASQIFYIFLWIIAVGTAVTCLGLIAKAAIWAWSWL